MPDVRPVRVDHHTAQEPDNRPSDAGRCVVPTASLLSLYETLQWSQGFIELEEAGQLLALVEEELRRRAGEGESVAVPTGLG